MTHGKDAAWKIGTGTMKRRKPGEFYVIDTLIKELEKSWPSGTKEITTDRIKADPLIFVSSSESTWTDLIADK